MRSELSQWWTSRGVKIQLTPSTNSDPVRNAGKHLGKASDANKNQGNAEVCTSLAMVLRLLVVDDHLNDSLPRCCWLLAEPDFHVALRDRLVQDDAPSLLDDVCVDDRRSKQLQNYRSQLSVALSNLLALRLDRLDTAVDL